MNDPTLVVSAIVFVVSLTMIVIRERRRVHFVAQPLAAPVQTRAAAASPADDFLVREIDRLREEQVQLRIEIDRLKRPTGPTGPMGTPAGG